MYTQYGSIEDIKGRISRLESNQIASFYRQGRRGTRTYAIDQLITMIEKNESLSLEEKIEYEKQVAHKVSPNWGGIGSLNRSLYNIVLAIHNGSGFVNQSKLASVENLKRYGLIYSEYKYVKATQIIPAIEGVSPETEVEVQRTIMVYKLTEFAKSISQSLYNKGQGVINDEVQRLKRLGAI